MPRLLVVILYMLSGCVGNPASDPVSNLIPGDSNAAEIVVAAGRSRLDTAIALLREHAYERTRTVQVSDEKGGLVIRRSHRTHFSGPAHDRLAVIVDTSSNGTGSAEFWAAYMQGPTREDSVEWSARLLPGDPLVLARQGPSYYRYAALGDTTIKEVSIARIEAHLASGSNRQGIQSARFYVDAEAGELVGFDLLYAHQSLLFDETSRFRYLLAAGPNADWLPIEVSVNTFLNLPLTKGQRFQLETTYEHEGQDDTQ